MVDSTAVTVHIQFPKVHHALYDMRLAHAICGNDQRLLALLQYDLVHPAQLASAHHAIQYGTGAGGSGQKFVASIQSPTRDHRVFGSLESALITLYREGWRYVRTTTTHRTDFPSDMLLELQQRYDEPDPHYIAGLTDQERERYLDRRRQAHILLDEMDYYALCGLLQYVYQLHTREQGRGEPPAVLIHQGEWRLLAPGGEMIWRDSPFLVPVVFEAIGRGYTNLHNLRFHPIR